MCWVSVKHHSSSYKQKKVILCPLSFVRWEEETWSSELNWLWSAFIEVMAEEGLGTKSILLNFSFYNHEIVTVRALHAVTSRKFYIWWLKGRVLCTASMVFFMQGLSDYFSSFINIGAASLTHIFSRICLVGTISCQVLLAASPAALAPVRQINRSDGSWK